MNQKLFTPIDNAPLIVFRIFFGLLLFAESIGAILTGWVKANFIDPEFTFSYIGLEWLQPLPGNGMYFYFAAMGLLGILIMIGYKYRLSIGLFTLLWAGAYFMQKSSYNNHYYLLLLICIILFFLPANRFASLDAKINPQLKSLSMPRWCAMVMIAQIAIVYFFAAISKFYPDWTNGSFVKILFENSAFYASFESIFSQHWSHLFIAYSGIAFDLLIVPFLLWKKTRTFALIASIIFHLFNAIFLQIGIFPFFALSFVVFFYPPEKIRQVFFRKKIPMQDATPIMANKSVLLYFFIPYFILQIALPIRHHFIKGDVFWTEEGHRMSWRMMLRQRSGTIQFEVVNKKTKAVTLYDYRSKLTFKQKLFVQSKPDGIWQMAQRIKNEYQQQGKDVSIYINCYVTINGKPELQFIDPKVDFATAKWDYFFHNDWILLYDSQGKPIK